jgi:hypothetical protein
MSRSKKSAKPSTTKAAAAPTGSTATCKATPAADLTKSTPKLDKLPDQISLPSDLCKAMDRLTKASIDSSGNSKEHGGTLALDKKGNLVLVNEGGTNSTSGTFSPDTKVDSDHTYVGTFHTHPYGKNDGDWNGAHMPFSGGDVGTIDDYHEKVSVVQSGNTKYVLVPTDKTPATIKNSEADKEYDKVFDPEYKKQANALADDAFYAKHPEMVNKDGTRKPIGNKPSDRALHDEWKKLKQKSLPEAASRAGEKATLALAKKYNLGYYKGDDCSCLARVNP